MDYQNFFANLHKLRNYIYCKSYFLLDSTGSKYIYPHLCYTSWLPMQFVISLDSTKNYQQTLLTLPYHVNIVCIVDIAVSELKYAQIGFHFDTLNDEIKLILGAYVMSIFRKDFSMFCQNIFSMWREAFICQYIEPSVHVP